MSSITSVLTAACLFAVPALALGEQSTTPAPAGIPKDAIMVTPCVQGMGQHWANPLHLPFGPIYGVYDGQLVFTEVMVDQQHFVDGKSFDKILAPLPGHAIDHVDIDFQPHGHEGHPIPHYDIHAYYVGHDAHMAFCPDGLPVPK